MAKRSGKRGKSPLAGGERPEAQPGGRPAAESRGRPFEPPRIQFLGAAGTVTGSRFLVTAGGKRILIDCGLFQGPKEIRQRNWQPFPRPAAEIDAVLLTHAHIDHTGFLPRLFKEGFDGPVFATEATVDLLGLLLPDSGHLQEEEAEFANRAGYSKHKPALPLYTEEEARQVVSRLGGLPYQKLQEIAPGLAFQFARAGHILGSAFIELRLEDGRGKNNLLFTGDLGRPRQPIIPDPVPAPFCDILVLESTYGNRRHGEEDPKSEIEKLLAETAARKGVLLIPAFAIGRAQQILYWIRELEDEKRIPRLPVYLDSPMAIDAVSVFLRHRQEHDLEMRKLMDDKLCPLRPEKLQMLRRLEDSLAVDEAPGPAVILSASGMATGGRVLHHLKRRLPDPLTTVAFVGFQAAGTRGRALVDGARSIRIHGQQVPVAAEVRFLSSLSAHADREEILGWLSRFSHPPRETFLVHGEPDAANSLQQEIERRFQWKVSVPAHLESAAL